MHMHGNTLSAFATELLNGCLQNLAGMKVSWPRTCIKVFRPDPPKGGSRGGGYVTGVPFFKKLLLQTRRLQRQTKWIVIIKKHVGRSVDIFGFISKSKFWRVFGVFLDFLRLVWLLVCCLYKEVYLHIF